MPTPAFRDALDQLMAFGTVVVRVDRPSRPLVALETLDGAIPRDAVVRIRVARPEPPRETLIERRVRLWKRPMFTLKDDDPQITWDHKAMAARPFRERKQ